MKKTFKNFWSVLLTILLSVVSLCLIQWNSINQNKQNEMYKVSQQKIIVTFNQNTNVNKVSQEVKDIITNSSFEKKENIKVNVETKTELQKFLSNNDIKIDKKNIGVAFVISNFKSDSDYSQLLNSLKSEQKDNHNMSLVESMKTNNDNVSDEHNNVAFIAIIIVSMLLLTIVLILKNNKLTKNYILDILNGKSFGQVVTNQSLWLFALSFVTVALTLLVFGMFNMITDNSTNMIYLLSNVKLLASGLCMSLYVSVLHLIINKIKIKKQVTW